MPVVQQHRTNLRAEARRLFPEAARTNPRFDVAVDTILSAMQGAALSAGVLRELPEATTAASFLEDVCRRELGLTVEGG